MSKQAQILARSRFGCFGKSTVALKVSCIPENVVCDELVSGYDFMPILLDYLDMQNPEAYKLPGKSFKLLLLGEKMVGRENIVYDEYGPVRMIRTRDWKYVHRYPYGPHELYDIINDPDEKVNLEDEENYKEILQSMKVMLEKWFLKYVDPALDGVYQAVMGTGQLSLAGPASKGGDVYGQILLQQSEVGFLFTSS